MERRNTDLLVKWLFFVFVLNLVYNSTFSWSQTLQGLSPASGVFQPVPILGFYSGGAARLLLGAVFCLCLGSYVVKRRWLLFVLAAAQLFQLAIQQVRATYVAIPLILGVLVVLGEFRKLSQLTFVLSLGLIALLFITLLGIRMSGRIGTVDLSFLEEHAESLTGKSSAPAEGSVEDRRKWAAHVWKGITSSTPNFLFGQGFGFPLIEFGGRNKINNQVVATRQPHNSHLTIFARLGLLGLTLWVMFNLCIVTRFIFALRRRAYGDRKLYDLILWLFFYYIVATLEASVQPGFDFSAGAIPFYFLMGFSLGTLRWQLGPQTRVGCKQEAPNYALA